MITIAYAAVWFFVFSVPWENIIVVPGFGAASRVTGVLALGCTLAVTVMSGRIRRWHLFHFAAFLFLMWAAVELFLFHADQRLPYKFWTYVQLFAVVWMMWQIAQTPSRQYGLFFAYVLGAFVAAVDTVFVYRREVGTVRRFAAEGFNANDLAMILALAIPMAWYLAAKYRQPILRWICRAYLPIGLVALGMTGSRGGLLAGVVGLSLIPLSMTKLSPGRLAAAMVILCATGVAATKYVPDTAIQRLATTRSEMQEGQLGGRKKIWRAGWQAFLRRPFMGYGTSSFISAIRPALGANAMVAHNSFLSVLVEQGIGGFLIFMTMLAAVYSAIRTLVGLERRFALVLMATLMIAMLPLSWEDNKSTWVILAALLGLAETWRVVRNTSGAPPAPAVPFPGARMRMAQHDV